MDCVQDTRTDFGRDVDMFCAKYKIKKSQLATWTDTHYQFLSNCCYGRYGKKGHELKPKIYAFIKQYEAEQERMKKNESTP